MSITRITDAGAKYGLLTSGDIAVTTSAASISGTSWRATYNQLGDLSSAPVIVSTGAGNVVLDFATNGSSLSGAATVALGSTGSASGTFAVTKNASNLDVAVTHGTASISAGPATASLTDGTGSFSVTSTGTSGTIHGNVALAGVPGLAFSSPLDLTFNTATSTYGFSGTAPLHLP